jgi:hypothetical protein
MHHVVTPPAKKAKPQIILRNIPTNKNANNHGSKKPQGMITIHIRLPAKSPERIPTVGPRVSQSDQTFITVKKVDIKTPTHRYSR